MRDQLIIASVAVTLVALASPARADYYADQQNEHLRRIEYAQSRVQTAWFDGKPITDASASQAMDLAIQCRFAQKTFDDVYREVDAQFRAGERAKQVLQRQNEIRSVCSVIVPAVDAYRRDQEAKKARAADEQRLELGRANVRAELFGKLSPYRGTLMDVMPGFADIESTGGFTESPQFVAKYLKELAEVQKICRDYPNVTNPVRPPNPRALESHAVEVCKTAALGPEEVIRQYRRGRLIRGITSDIERYIRYVQPILDGTEKAVSDVHQALAWDRARWVTLVAKDLVKDFEQIKEPIPPDLYAGMDDTAAKLRAKLEAYGASEKFTMPSYRDAQVEALVKKAAASELKGSTIYKIGLDYKTWVAYDERTWVKSDATYDYYRVSPGKNRYKRGWILVKLAGQPVCQAREFIVSRVRSGPIHVDSLDGGGRFMRCD